MVKGLQCEREQVLEETDIESLEDYRLLFPPLAVSCLDSAIV